MERKKEAAVTPEIDICDKRIHIDMVHSKSLVAKDDSVHLCKDMQQFIHEQYKEALPNLLIADWGLAIPMSTADSERDFSRLGLIKTAKGIS